MQTVKVERNGKAYEIPLSRWLDMQQTGRAKGFKELPEKKITFKAPEEKPQKTILPPADDTHNDLSA